MAIETGGVSGFIRSNILGLIAIFVALSGTTIALPGRNTVDSGDIKNRQVKTKDLANQAVTAGQLADGAVGSAQIAARAIGSNQVADGAINSAKVAQNSLTGDDIDESTLSGLGGGGGGPTGPAGGDLAGTYPNPTVNEANVGIFGDVGGTLSNTTVNESALGLGGDLGGSVANAQIGSGAVGATELANNAVVGGTGGDVQDGSLTGADVADGSLGPDDIDESSLDAAAVDGLSVLSVTDNAIVGLNGMTLVLACFTGPNTTFATVTTPVDNSKAYVEFTDGAQAFEGDLDNGETALASTTAASGLVTVRFQNGTNNRVVSAELAWRSNYGGGCPGNDVEAFGRAIG